LGYFVEFAKIRQAGNLRREVERKERKRAQRRSKLIISTFRSSNVVPFRFTGELCFVKNPNWVIDNLLRLKRELSESGKNVHLIFEKVDYLSPAAFYAIISFTIHELEDLKVSDKRRKFKLFLPKKRQPREAVAKTGALNFFFHKKWRIKRTKKSEAQMLSYSPHTKANLDYIDDVCHKYSTVPKSNAAQALYGALGEAIDNSLKHAYNQMYIGKWWLCYYIDEPNKKYVVTIIDFGKGILKTIKKKAYKKKLATFAARINFLSSKADNEVLRLVFDGKLKSSTGDPNQGSGAETIYENATLSCFDSFICITNNCRLMSFQQSIDEADIVLLNQSFPGTLYQFTLCTTKAKMF
jgi:hypothetical protein